MLDMYKTVERLYANKGAPSAEEARRARVKEILDEIHERDRPEKAAEKRDQVEADPPATPQDEDPPSREAAVPLQPKAARRGRR
jgi:hypothetical protein